MFRGSYTARIDEKGRLKLPSEYRALLEQMAPEHQFYITSFDGSTARIFPMPEWERFEERLAAGPSMHPIRQKLMRDTSYFGQVVEMDTQGRVLIPSRLREAAAMQGEVTVMGNLKYLEVWNKQRLEDDRKARPLTEADWQSLADIGY